MLKKTKKLLSMVALVLVISILASCGPQTQTTSSDAPLELTVWKTQGTDYIHKEMTENIPEEWLFDKTGVIVKNIYGNDGGQWDMKLTKLVAGDNLPDIVYCQAGQGPSHFNNLDRLGKVWYLSEDLLKQHAPNIWEKTPSEVWDLFRNADGDILGIPFLYDADDIDIIYPEYTEEEKDILLNAKSVPVSGLVTTLSIRDDVLKQIYPEAKSYDELVAMLENTDRPIGDDVLDVPITSTEEFIDFMYKIRDLNIVEDGKKVYAYGFAGDGNDNWESLCYLGNMMYGGTNHEYPAHWNTKTEKMEVPCVTDFIKEMARTQNRMILDKVIDPESLAHTGAQFKAKVMQGRYVICRATAAGAFAMLNSQLEEMGKDYKYRPLYINIPAVEGYDAYKVDYSFKSSFCILNTLSEEEMIRVLEWADLQYTEEFEEIFNWGRPEDDLYTEIEDGKRQFKDSKLQEYFVNGDKAALEVVDSKGLGNLAGRFFVRPMEYTKWSPDVYNKNINYTPTVQTGFKFANDSKIVASVVDAPPNSAVSSEFAAVEELVEYWARREEWETAIKKAIAAGEGEFDAKWNDMLAVLNNIVDVEEMERKMTEIALPYYEAIKNKTAE